MLKTIWHLLTGEYGARLGRITKERNEKILVHLDNIERNLAEYRKETEKLEK